jgi:hypothetical protein
MCLKPIDTFRFGVEIKGMDEPSLSMRFALANRPLEHLTVVYLGKLSS